MLRFVRHHNFNNFFAIDAKLKRQQVTITGLSLRQVHKDLLRGGIVTPRTRNLRHTRPPQNLAVAVDQLERELIQSTLDTTLGNISEAARLLGVTRRGLYLKLRRLGLESPSVVDVDV